MNVAIDDIIVSTENCSLRPYFAQPGDLSHACFILVSKYLFWDMVKATKLAYKSL